MNTPELFTYEGQQVRSVMRDDEPWFVLADVCAVLDLTNPSVVSGRIDHDALSTAEVIDSMGRTQTVRVVDEGGLYQVVFLSRKPDARRFRRWVTHEVIPNIRRTGSYGGEPELTGPELMARAVLEAQATIAARDERIAQLQGPAAAWEHLASAAGDYSVGDAAKVLSRDPAIEIGQRRLFTWLHDERWIFRGQQGAWRAYQNRVNSGWLCELPQSHHHPRTGELVLDPPQVRISVKGLERLHKLLGGTTPAVLAETEPLQLTP